MYRTLAVVVLVVFAAVVLCTLAGCPKKAGPAPGEMPPAKVEPPKGAPGAQVTPPPPAANEGIPAPTELGNEEAENAEAEAANAAP